MSSRCRVATQQRSSSSKKRCEDVAGSSRRGFKFYDNRTLLLQRVPCATDSCSCQGEQCGRGTRLARGARCARRAAIVRARHGLFFRSSPSARRKADASKPFESVDEDHIIALQSRCEHFRTAISVGVAGAGIMRADNDDAAMTVERRTECVTVAVAARIEIDQRRTAVAEAAVEATAICRFVRPRRRIADVVDAGEADQHPLAIDECAVRNGQHLAR